MKRVRAGMIATAVVAAAFTVTLASAPYANSVAAPAAQGNPLATEDQTAVMARALKLIDTPEVKQARARAAFMWKAVLHDDPPAEAWASFESMMDDFTYNYALKAANSDPNYPKILHVYTPPRQWRGMSVPGSRWGGDNPDNVYRIIPIDSKAHYRLDGRRIGIGPTDVSYTLVGNYETSKTLSTTQGRDVPVNRDGTFSITLDPSAANGRPSHIQTKPGSVFLFIRDTLGDWNQKPNALTINRLDPPDAAPLTDQQAAERAASIMIDGLPYVYYVVKLPHDKPNQMPALFNPGLVGGLVTQRNSSGQAQLNDDEALVVTVEPAGAAYYMLVAQNYWYITIDYANHTSSLANGQVTTNADGTTTYVVSIKDPGVHNWIDVGGLRNPVLQMRVQGLPRPLPNEPSIKSRLVKLSDLKTILPKETKWVTSAERAAQIAQRRAQLAARLADQ